MKELNVLTTEAPVACCTPVAAPRITDGDAPGLWFELDIYEPPDASSL